MGWGKLKASFGYSIQGLMAAWASDRSFRLEVIVGLFLLPCAFYLSQDRLDYLLLVGSYLWVILVELLNTAVEALVDRIDQTFHPLAKRAKDCGSAAVFISLIAAAMVWITVIFF